MKFFASTLLASALVVLCSGCDSNSEAGFVDLFNGRDLTGWRYPDGPAFEGRRASSDQRFSAENGILVVHPKTPRKALRLVTTREFPHDFILRLEFRAAVGADSGIFIRRPQL